MKEVYEFPPNMDAITKTFGSLPANVIFTYGDTIYNPSQGFIDTYLMTHESVHTKQQGDKVEEWWWRYLNDKKFRLDQEIPAYHNQYNHFCRNKKDPHKWEMFLERLALDLSGRIYGELCTLEEARKYIKQGHV